jgi:hypothetical protein
MSTILLPIQQAITRYLFPVVVVVGNIGNLLIIAVFTQRSRRTNACSLYLLFNAVANLVNVNWALIPIIYALEHPPDPVGQSLILCRMRGYILHVTSNYFRSLVVLACFDRFAMSSVHVSIRSWSSVKVASRAIPLAFVSWLFIASHLLIFEDIQNGRCGTYGLYGKVFSIYTIIINILPGCLMIVAGFLTMRNMHHRQTRINPLPQLTNKERHTHKKEFDLLKIVVAEVCVYLILNTSYPADSLYMSLTSDTVKSADRVRIETFVNFIAQSCLLYFISSSNFFIYMASSSSFRQEVKKILLRFKRQLRHQPAIISRITMEPTAVRRQGTTTIK